ncbi:MAG: hypothetical protein ACLTDZ_11415 [Oscillospiraceae bacterium]
MADKAISELIAAEQIKAADLFVLEQDSAAKKLTGQILLNWLTAAADGHGGISSIVKQSTSGLTDTYRITMADTTTFDFTVKNGRGISAIAKVSVSGLVDTYRITYNDNTTSTFTVTNGAKGDKGDNAYVWIRYASQKPTAASHSFGVLPDNWMGVYSGNSATAPTDWTKYQWFEIKGEKGDIGNPALLTSQSVTYQASTSGNVIPSGNWQGSIPTVAQGAYLWTRIAMTFNSGDPIYAYSVSRMGLDGTGAVSKVCGKEPNSNGNVELEAENVGALPSAGGLMTGNIVMNSHQIKALGAPTDSADAATKGYVDTALSNAKTIAKTATLTAAGWSASAPYTQSVTVSGLTDTKRAMAYPVYGSNTAINLALKEACGMVSFASRSGSVLTFTCLEDKPTVNIPITVEVYV